MGDLNRDSQDLEILNRIARALNRSTTLNDALETTLEQVAQLLGLETGWIFLLHPDDGASYLAATQNLPPGLQDNPGEMEGRCYCLDSFREGDMDGAANINTITCSRLKWMRENSRAGLRFHASIPLYAHETRMGILNVASKDWRELTKGELSLLHTIGDMVGIAIERARLFDQSLEVGRLEERNRLARELHDTLAQDLAGVTLQVETASALIDGAASTESIQSCLERALSELRHTLEDVQRSVLDLRAAPLEGKSLPDALEELVALNRSSLDGELSLTILGRQHPLSHRLEIGLYRIVQEGVRNVIQHAAASHIHVSLQLSPETVTLSIKDNGAGFDPAAVRDGAYGLIGMKERTQLLNGHFKLETTQGEGTSIRIVVPVE